jgi:hypothetical protein
MLCSSLQLEQSGPSYSSAHHCTLDALVAFAGRLLPRQRSRAPDILSFVQRKSGRCGPFLDAASGAPMVVMIGAGA